MSFCQIHTWVTPDATWDSLAETQTQNNCKGINKREWILLWVVASVVFIIYFIQTNSKSIIILIDQFIDKSYIYIYIYELWKLFIDEIPERFL